MNSTKPLEMNVLKLTLHEHLVGYLCGFKNGKNIFTFSETFKNNFNRPTFSLTTHPQFPRSTKLMSQPWARNQQLHPILSNLLPEGALRELIAQSLKVHPNNEFNILSYLGTDLPGALIVEPIQSNTIPQEIMATCKNAKLVEFEHFDSSNKFSLAGVQIKFSLKEKEGRYIFSNDNVLGDWIVKTPSTKHKDVPLNEYTAMMLASMVDVHIPEIKLVEIKNLENLPPINLPNEKFAFAIKRFDRDNDMRIHMEDFAQILIKYPEEKYNSANYEQIADVLFQYSGDGLADIQQLARRLLVNILLANGDAHLKNWSVLYSDQITPRLSPAYDILTTNVYIKDENQCALNLGKTKNWYQHSYAHFENWANKVNIPWKAIQPHLKDTLEKAKDLWPDALQNLPMNEKHKQSLKMHWKQLHPDFKLN